MHSIHQIHPLLYMIHHCLAMQTLLLQVQQHCHCHFLIHQIILAWSQREACLSRHLDLNPLHIDLLAHTNDPPSHSSDCHRPPIGHCDHGIPGYKALHHSRNKTLDHYRYHPNPTTQHLQCSHHQNQCLQSSDNNHQTDITHPLFHAIHHCTIIRLRHLPAQANYYYHFSIHQITPAQSQREAHLSRHLDSNPLHIDLPAHTNDPPSHSSDCHRPPIGHCDHGIPGYKALHHSRNKT